jgi:hypothetical protein
MHLRHCILELEEVARGLFDRTAHKFGAEGAVLRQLMGVPTGYECQVPAQSMRNRPRQLKVRGGWGKSSGTDGTVGFGIGVAVP